MHLSHTSSGKSQTLMVSSKPALTEFPILFAAIFQAWLPKDSRSHQPPLGVPKLSGVRHLHPGADGDRCAAAETLPRRQSCRVEQRPPAGAPNGAHLRPCVRHGQPRDVPGELVGKPKCGPSPILGNMFTQGQDKNAFHRVGCTFLLVEVSIK